MPPLSLHWFAAQQQTSTVRRQKYGCFCVKFSAESNGFSLFFLKTTGSYQKMAKTKVVRETATWRRSEAKG